MKNKIPPTSLQENQRDSEGEFHKISHAVFGAERVILVKVLWKRSRGRSPTKRASNDGLCRQKDPGGRGRGEGGGDKGKKSNLSVKFPGKFAYIYGFRLLVFKIFLPIQWDLVIVHFIICL